MLSARGVGKVYNLSGGFKAWQGNVALGPADQGLELFSGRESVEDVLVAGYALEKGLMDFYQQMVARMKNPAVKKLFHQLFSIEINHQNRLLAEYNRITGKSFANADFDREIAVPAMEGGLSSQEYMRLFSADLDSPADVVGLAMSIEAQALDMYHRAAENARDQAGREVLRGIAREEQEHLKLLGQLMDEIEG